MTGRNIEEVRGIVIGECSRHIKLFAPNGNVQRQDWIGMQDEPEEWGRRIKGELLGVECGDGKPLSDHPYLVSSIFGPGDNWTVKVEL